MNKAELTALILKHDAAIAVLRRATFHTGDYEQAQWDAMPERITVYRGYCKDGGTENGLSWTTDPKVAEFFGKSYFRTGKRTTPAIAERVISRSDATAFCMSRNESEVIYLEGELMSRPRGFKQWVPCEYPGEVIDAVNSVLVEYEDYLPMTNRRLKAEGTCL